MSRSLLFRRRSDDETLGASHEQLFVDLYPSLLAAAKRVCGSNQDAVEDLLQDAYVQFVVLRPALDEVVSVTAYLSTLLRNLYVSRLRLKANQPALHVDIADFDSVELALRSTSASDGERLIARDALVRICTYVCERKGASRTASALALRFFHGLLPSELARVAGVSPAVVHVWLSRARVEARACAQGLAGGTRPAHRGRETVLRIRPIAPGEIVASLRSTLFAHLEPPCPPAAVLRDRLAGVSQPPADARELSHLASCQACLALIRSYLDIDGEDSEPPAGRHAFGRRNAADMRVASTMKAGARRGRELLEHRPRSLRVSVNGVQAGIVAVTGRACAQWTVRVDEPIGFAEIHSEQGVRLLFLPLTPLGAGAIVQRQEVRLSEGRSVALQMDFSGPHAIVRVEYATAESEYGDAVDLSDRPQKAARVPAVRDGRAPWWTRYWRRWSPATTPGRFQLPGIGTLALATTCLGVVVGGWWLTFERQPAWHLLEQAARSERAAVAQFEVEHSRLSFITEHLDGGPPVKRTVERWRTVRSGDLAVRVFDDTGLAVAGLWRAQGHPESVRTLGVLDSVWQDGLSVEAFRRRYGATGSCRAETAPDRQTITCTPEVRSTALRSLFPVLADATATPVRAELVMRRADLHAVALTLLIDIDTVRHRVRLVEESFSGQSLSVIPPGTFEPDRPAPTLDRPAPPTARRSEPRTVSASDELRLVALLDRLGTTDDLSLTRDELGQLVVAGVVERPDARERIAVELRRLAGPQARLAFRIQTFAEARQAAVARAAARQDTPLARAELHELPAGPVPFEGLLSPSAQWPDAAALTRELATQLLPASRTARREARALRAFLERYPVSTTGAYDADARRDWRDLVVRRAERARTALGTVLTRLQPYLDQGTASLPPATSLEERVRRLDRSTAIVDDALSYGFTAGASGTDVPVPMDPGNDLRQAAADADAVLASAALFH